MSEDLVAIARNPEEMQIAQVQLVDWVNKKLGSIAAETSTVSEDLHVAEENGWRTSGYRRQVKKLERQFQYYEKMKTALEAGYVLVPNFQELDVFAIRVKRTDPSPNAITTSPRFPERPIDQESDSPAAGEGKYVSEVASTNKELVHAEEGKDDRLAVWAADYQDVDFPLRLAKPVILKETSKAMMMRLFDDIGILPRRRSKGDPMVIGRIHFCRGARYSRKTASFLIAWYVDTRDL